MDTVQNENNAAVDLFGEVPTNVKPAAANTPQRKIEDEESEGIVVCEKRLLKVVATNARRARDINGYSRKHAQKLIFNYRNPDMHPNRISELESGNKRIDLKTLYKMCIGYSVSADFLLGLSDEFEHNSAAAYNGMIIGSMRGAMTEATDRLCMKMSELMRFLPPFQGELLRAAAKDVIAIVDRMKADIVFRSQCADLIDAVEELRSKTNMFDHYVARQMRIVESTMLSQIESLDEKTMCSMSSVEDTPVSEKY